MKHPRRSARQRKKFLKKSGLLPFVFKGSWKGPKYSAFLVTSQEQYDALFGTPHPCPMTPDQCRSALEKGGSP